MSNAAQFFGSQIKSIQRGTITISGATSATATITAVNTSKSELRFLGARTKDDTVNAWGTSTIELTNSTTITARWDSAAFANTNNVSWELTEFY